MPLDNIAHARKLESGQWADPHQLDEHLQQVAQLAQTFAQSFSPEWAAFSGLWHDLGKYRPKFQAYIRKKSGFEEDAHIENAPNRVTHSTAGAIHAMNQLGPYGAVLAYIIAGHHAGLPDWETKDSGKAGLKFRLTDGCTEYHEVMAKQSDIPDEILRHDITQLQPPDDLTLNGIALWIRMLFSCLVDADFLDTERYMAPDKAKSRKQYPTLPSLQHKFIQHMATLQAKADKKSLNKIRSEVYQQCVQAGRLPTGHFSLTVPTGGGKTLSSLAFAFEHAAQKGKCRIIYAIPFTSIIEQNADVFRKILGDDAIIEHHSNLDTDPKEENLRRRLAAENWDAPIIVTTNVQLFESLFAARPSRCRKLHNLINSVIILDEAQQIPREFQAPITQVMQQLSDHYGVTWLLCTATQPELGKSQDSFGRVLLEGLKDVREIVPDPENLARMLKRVDVVMPEPDSPRVTWDDIALKLQNEPAVLAIVNTRRHARELFQAMQKDKNTWHLSGQMCPHHRRQVIKDIHQRLKDRRAGKTDEPLRIISTQLIEAGVDVDFPVVYRALAGLDSIAQSAGRCNREDKMQTRGQVVVFRPPENAPIGLLRQGQQVTEELMKGGMRDVLSPKSFTQYFASFNHRGDRDEHGICSLLTAPGQGEAPLALSFRSAAEKFQLINDAGISVIVPYIPKGKKESPVTSWLNMLNQDQSQKWIYRALQGYTVNLPETQVKMMYQEGAIEPVAGQYVLNADKRYDPQLGLLPPESLLSAEDSVI